MRNESGQCIRAIQGEVLSIRRRKPSSEPVGSRFELGQVTGSVALSTIDEHTREQIVLERIAVPPGLELRFVALQGRDPSVLGSSLHYLGQRSAPVGTLDQNTSQVRWIQSNTESAFGSVPPINSAAPTIVAVDCDDPHCRDVLNVASKAWSVYGQGHVDVNIVGVCREVTASTFGLYDYIETLAQLRMMPVCPDAIVLSVDFGLACLHDPLRTDIAGGHVFEGAAAVAAYSFPVAEMALRLILDECSNKRAGKNRVFARPAIFAAAGNRQESYQIRQRLAYPALLPDAIAVTHVSQTSSEVTFVPNQWADLPLAHDLKPIFALDETIPIAHGADVDGTSFAAPWAASWYVAVREQAATVSSDVRAKLDLPLSRMALLQGACERVSISASADAGAIAQSPASLIPASVGRFSRESSPSLVDRIAAAIMQLNQRFPTYEFALAGSAVALIMLASRGPISAQHVRTAPGDIDLVYFGPAAPDDGLRRQMREDATAALKPFFAVWPDHIELTDAEGRVAPMSLCQAVIPPAAMMLTAGGLLDAWHGLEDIVQRRIRVNWPLESQGAYRNPAAAVEHYALIPSILTALKLVIRLHLEDRKTSGDDSAIDLVASCDERIIEALRADGAKVFNERTCLLLRKLIDIQVNCGMTLSEIAHAAPNWWRSVVALSDGIYGVAQTEDAPVQLASISSAFRAVTEMVKLTDALSKYPRLGKRSRLRL